jgi:hypothetical protein
MKDEALKLALGALEAETDPNWECNSYHPKIWEAITAIKQALAAQPPVQPVAWLYKADAEFDGKEWHDSIRVTTSKQVADWQGKDIQPLYTTPPAAQPAVPDALNPKDENPAYAAGWNDCRAEMLKGMK